MIQYLLVGLGAIMFMIVCIGLLKVGKDGLMQVLLFAGAFALRLYMAMQDAFLHDWDERFHALVARNLMNDPLRPLLRANPIMPYNRFEWCCNHIWLHKQPLFMWQMALSMKLFGVSEFSIRYPSVLMGALMPVMVYSIAQQVLKNKQAALVAALLMALCNFHVELISGLRGTDHNDVAFGFYVLASFWAYTRYTAGDRKVVYALLAGLFAGCAIMNKWLTGAIVFAGWGINVLLAIRDKEGRKEIVHFVLAILVACIVFVPWQLYILHAFPEEARYEYAYNSRHITEVIEDHKGSIFFYLRQFPAYYGWLACLLLPLGICSVGKQCIVQWRTERAAVALLTVFIVVFSFFSFVVATKWVPYVFVITPLGYILAAAGLWQLKQWWVKKETGIVVVTVVVGLFTLNPLELYKAHNPADPTRINKAYNTAIYKEVAKELPKDVRLVLNTNSFEDLDMMFYHNELNVYSWCMHENIIDSLKKNNVPFAVFKEHGVYGVPAAITSYSKVFVIDKELR